VRGGGGGFTVVSPVLDFTESAFCFGLATSLEQPTLANINAEIAAKATIRVVFCM
jgi:hypothetical protein